jgi:hypothetical protein
MDDDGSYHGIVDEQTGRRRVEARPSAGEPYAIPGSSWGWEGDSPRALARALLEDLVGYPPLPEMAWALNRDLLADGERFASMGGWTLPAAELAAWRRAWLRSPARRGLLERTLAGALLRAPARVDPALLQGRRERLIAELAGRAADAATELDLETVGIAIAALRLGDDVSIAERWHAEAPEGPGPWFWAAQLQAVGRT